jgi:hypothetical protein
MSYTVIALLTIIAIVILYAVYKRKNVKAEFSLRSMTFKLEAVDDTINTSTMLLPDAKNKNQPTVLQRGQAPRADGQSDDAG